MTDPSKIKEFPDISSKLSAPTKKSAFEKQKAEAEAKRIREEAENAAALKEFQASFDDDDEEDSPLNALNSNRPGNGGYGSGPPGMGAIGLGGGPKRHFTQIRGQSGPGTLGPAPGLPRKRGYDGSFTQQQRDRGIFAYEDSSTGSRRALQDSEDEDEGGQSHKAAEKAALKPTVQLSCLPPGTSDATIKALFPSNIKVDRIQPLPPSGPGSTERKSMSAIVTLGKDIPANEIDSAVSALSKKYLGKGYYLSIARHLSSASLGSSIHNATTTNSSLPFGAKVISTAPLASTLSRAPPPGFRPGFAPPASLTGGTDQFTRSPISTVRVKSPTDLRQLKLINKTIESILTHGEEFEAILMAQKDVREDEKWAWLWDPRSVGGVYYRWRLWSIKSKAVTDEEPHNRNGDAPPQILFEDETPWQEPQPRPRFEFTGYIDEFLSDDEFESADEKSDDEGAAQKRNAEIDVGLGEPTHAQYLNPLWKAKFTHLLARLPTSTARLRRGDVARVTNFAICHAAAGAEEIVQMLMQNIDKPYSLTDANIANRQSTDYGYGAYHSDSGNGSQSDSEYEPEEVIASIEPSSTSNQLRSGSPTFTAESALKSISNQPITFDSPKDATDLPQKEKEDDTPAKLIGLYVVSDILSSCSTAGVKNAWKYKPLIEAAMKDLKIFERLGRVEKDKGWGRIKAERWRNSVMHLLGIWEGWNVFSVGVPAKFEEAFKNPPLTAGEAKEAKEKEDREKKAARAKKGKWKSMKGSGQVRSEEPEVDRRKPLGQEISSGQTVAKIPKKEPSSEPPDVEMEEGEIDGGPMETDTTPLRAATSTTEPNNVASSSEPAHFKPVSTVEASTKAAEPGLASKTPSSVAAQEQSGNVDSEEKKPVGFSIAAAQPKMLVSKGANRPRAVDMFADSDED